MKSLLFLALGLGSGFAFGGDLDQRDAVIEFFKTKVLNRSVSATTNKPSGDFHQTWKYENLNVTGQGLTYDEVVEIEQTVFQVDANGVRVGAGDKRDRKYRTRTELGQLVGTDQLLGFKRFLSSSFRDVTGRNYNSKAEVDGDKLIITFDDAQPSSWKQDPPATGYDIIQSKHVETLWVDANGKLNRLFVQNTEVLDPKTLKVISTKPEFRAEQKEE